MEKRISSTGIVAKRISRNEEDIAGNARNWVVDSMPEGLTSDLWMGMPLFDSEVKSWQPAK